MVAIYIFSAIGMLATFVLAVVGITSLLER